MKTTRAPAIINGISTWVRRIGAVKLTAMTRCASSGGLAVKR